jgi:hypothetical protein
MFLCGFFAIAHEKENLLQVLCFIHQVEIILGLLAKGGVDKE